LDKHVIQWISGSDVGLPIMGLSVLADQSQATGSPGLLLQGANGKLHLLRSYLGRSLGHAYAAVISIAISLKSNIARRAAHGI